LLDHPAPGHRAERPLEARDRRESALELAGVG
jgi:hypothetical protein